MQNFSKIFTHLKSIGLDFSLVGDTKLQVRPKDQITDLARNMIQVHKAEIVEHLTRRAMADHLLDRCLPQETTEAAKVRQSAEINIDRHQGRKSQETCLTGAASTLTQGHVKPSPIALTWLHEHRLELQRTGWSARELYRRNKSKGIMWLGLWSRPSIKVDLLPGGIVQFLFKETGQEITQTARPMNSTNQ